MHGRRMFARVSVRDTVDDDTSHAACRDIVMVHGLGISSRYMVPSGERLALYFNVYAPDLPGFGKSAPPPQVLNVAEMAEALESWMRANGLDRACFIGNSIGCQVLAHLAVKHPHYVDRMVFVGPTFDRTSRWVVPLLLRALYDSFWEPSSLSRLVVRDYLGAGPWRLIKTLYDALRDPIEPLLPHIEAPVLVVRGEHDAVVPQRWADKVIHLLPHARLKVIKGASHAVHFTAPDRFLRVALPFLLKQ